MSCRNDRGNPKRNLGLPAAANPPIEVLAPDRDPGMDAAADRVAVDHEQNAAAKQQ